ncbi:hypothetical protein [Actinophytocola algeriensis]|uniref:Uncharacterized protein n=1 Tax=Actinophytocola algeriensis TaxID=1768010 RepID=A0A7W7QFU9_9PSEU|nr:hypothetical protein [Actinophytocola algeriensis]MBB4912744.1 hypothetical protein [Actinophytocola algeriensis]MBE1473588.1 hypothetical protein [Actinophytocola algeriensis]
MTNSSDDGPTLPVSDEELARLRQRADQVGIQGHAEMSAEQLRKAIAERHRGADPHQAEIVARREDSG